MTVDGLFKMMDCDFDGVVGITDLTEFLEKVIEVKEVKETDVSRLMKVID